MILISDYNMNSLKKYGLKLILKFYTKSEILNSLLNSSQLQALNFTKSGYLINKGWWKSFENSRPQDINEKPLPWVTYSFIDFIEPRLTKEMVLFEYGSGNSTIYYSSMVEKVISVEHDKKFYNSLRYNSPANVELFFCELEYGGDYSRWSERMKQKYDLIIVDGRDRVNCMLNSVKSLSESGVIILDDSERESYSRGVKTLKDFGFKSLDFWGISPGFISYNKCTSIFYKDNNVLGI